MERVLAILFTKHFFNQSEVSMIDLLDTFDQKSRTLIFFRNYYFRIYGTVTEEIKKLKASIACG